MPFFKGCDKNHFNDSQNPRIISEASKFSYHMKQHHVASWLVLRKMILGVTLYVFMYWVPIIMEIIYVNEGVEGKFMVEMKEMIPNEWELKTTYAININSRNFHGNFNRNAGVTDYLDRILGTGSMMYVGGMLVSNIARSDLSSDFLQD